MPRYSEKPTTFDALLAPFPETTQHTGAGLRALIRRTFPDFDEHIYGGKAVGNALYSRDSPNRVLCGIQPAEDHCKLYVHHVSDVQLPGIKLEGRGKHARHVKVYTLTEATTVRLLELLQLAFTRWDSTT